MDELIDKIENESLEKIEITDEKPVEVISLEDLISKIEYQFSPTVEFGVDNADYIKWFAVHILNVPETSFPANVALYITDDNLEDYNEFIEHVEYNFKSIFGIRINNDEYEFENLYNLYYYFIIKPEELLVDYLLDYHFYKEGYDFKEFYKNKILSNNIPDFNIMTTNPTEVINNIKMHLTGSGKNTFNQMDYKYKFDMFMYYAKNIIQDPHEFKFYNIFSCANELSHCNTYDSIDDQINIYNNISYENDELIVDFIMKNILNTECRSVYITKKIIDVFFMRIRDFEMDLAQSINY